MDALTARERWALREALQTAGRLDAETHVASVELVEPPKADVLGWKPGTALRRQALAVLSRGASTFEALVDVSGGKLLSWRDVPGAQASLVESEQEALGELAKADERMIQGFRKRGIVDLATVVCFGISPGYFGTPEEEGRRLAIVRCWDRRGVFNADTRPIEGLYAWVDVGQRKLLRVVDEAIAPVPKGDVDVDALGPAREVPGPIRTEQPVGPGFRRRSGVVEWQNWSFHVRLEARRGPVPYMDPAESWYNSTFIDLGEYTAEGLLSSLEPGEDCPRDAVYLEGLLSDERGIPEPRPRAACLFEREAGSVSWRHLNWLTRVVDSRKSRELVLRSIANLGNYDYVFDWVFEQNGSLRVVVGSTGVVNTKAVNATSAERPGEDLAYGRRDSHEASLWRFVNRGVRGPNGYPVSLQVRPGHSADSLLTDDDFPQQRAGFIRHALWVTPYRPGELHAAGDYPTQSKGGDGLPLWTAADRPIENTDIVAWYTVGMHHVVRAEDFPIMPVVWHDFEIRPFDFFPRNPALDLPSQGGR